MVSGARILAKSLTGAVSFTERISEAGNRAMANHTHSATGMYTRNLVINTINLFIG
jgi:hypothetical protein